MDSGLKERLVGAAVLVALGVWFIPWVLDGPPAEELADDGVELPAPESAGQLQTRTIELDGEDADAPRDQAQAALDRQADAAAPPPAAIEAESGPAESGRSEPANDATKSVAAVAAAAPPPAATPPQQSAAAAPAAAAADRDGWFVQLGSFGDAENARRLAGRVATFGYDAEVSSYRSGGRTLSRVRVGPVAGRDEASAIASSLSAHGFVAQVVGWD